MNHPNCSDELSESTEDEFDFIESRWENGVETGLIISWPNASRSLHLSTKLTEDMIAPLFDGTQWAGTRVWKAAIVALEYLLKEHSSMKSLLELGCGLGVPSMLWHLLQENERLNTPSLSPLVSRKVVLTDMPDLLPQLEANVKENFPESYGKSIHAKALDWSTVALQKLWQEEINNTTPQQDNTTPQRVFDICLNCDCIYEPLYGRQAWESLADVLAEVARLSPSTLLVTSVERRTADGLDDFWERLKNTGTVQTIERVLRNDDDPHHVIEIYVTRGRDTGYETL